MALPSLDEPAHTAAALAVAGTLVLAAVALSRTAGRSGVPAVLVFMALGMVAGSEGLGGIAFEDYELTFQLGTAALAFILFDGGLNTSLGAVRSVVAPATLLATAGVAATALVVAGAAMLTGLGWQESLLLGAIVAPTDAAAVFSVLRGSGVVLRQRVAATLELESGLNDPMAVILTLGLTASLAAGAAPQATMLLEIPLQLVVGGALGWAIGHAGRWLLGRQRLMAGGLYPVTTIAISAIAFGLPTLLYGSGFLAVYVAGAVLGNGPLPHRGAIFRAHDFVAWCAQIVMFIVLGLLAFPSQLVGAAGPGLVITAALVLVARPLATWACLAPFGYAGREMAYVGWVGLRGAVPIILATVPIMAQLPRASELLNVVFFVVVLSALVQGTSVRRVTAWLGLQLATPPAPAASIEIASALPVQDQLLTYYIEPQSPVAGRKLSELSFPPGATAMMLTRGTELIAPNGRTDLRLGDHVTVLCKPGERDAVDDLFLARPAATRPVPPSASPA